MERNEAYKNVLIKILELEKQLSLCDNAIKECDQSAVEAEKKIEEHFARCANALAARKDTLLRELAHKAASQKKCIEDAKLKIKLSVDTSRSVAQSALLMFSISPVSAEDICKPINNIPTLLQVDARVELDLSTSIFDSIQMHGKITSPDNPVQFSKSVTASPTNATIIPPSVPENNRFSVASMVTTLAGSGLLGRVMDGKGTIASFSQPYGACFNPLDECLYVCDRESIRKVSMQGDMSTFATGVSGPLEIAINLKDKAFFVTCTNNTIARISFEGKTTTIAGNGTPGYDDGVGPNARFNCLQGIAIDQQTGHMFVCDHRNNMIRRLLPQG